MKYPILLPNIFNHPFTYESDINLKLGDYTARRAQYRFLSHRSTYRLDLTQLAVKISVSGQS